jgi:Fic family protein
MKYASGGVNMVQYVWQNSSWPNFRWDDASLLRPLGKARLAQGKVLGQREYFGLEIEAAVLTDEAMTTAAIEGERLDRDTVRSSIARRLGLPTTGLPPTERHIDGLVEMLIDATRNYTAPLTPSRLKGWQAALFPTGYSGLHRITVGEWRQAGDPMQVVSGPIGKEKVHYEAPPAASVPDEIKRFLECFRASRGDVDGLVRAAIAHFWFVTIHPFQDGNGRIARAIADMAFAQDENSGCRLYSMSAQINADRTHYYHIVERTQRGAGDITEWIVWFLNAWNGPLDVRTPRCRKL